MLYHDRGMDYEGDPYFHAPIAAYEAARGYRPGHYREATKTLTQALINASDSEKAKMCDLPNRLSFARKFTRAEVRQMIEEKHVAIAYAFGSGAGIRLQRKDSDLALAVITKLKDKGILALPIHDSFIVDADVKGELKNEMIQVYQQMFGFNPIVV